VGVVRFAPERYLGDRCVAPSRRIPWAEEM
jgi:hypothetical protein